MKKLLCLILAAAMLLSLFGCVGAAETISREEIPILSETDHIVSALKQWNILVGTGEGLELEREVTRAEAVALIWRTSGLSFNDLAYETPIFSDIEEHWAADAIEKFARAGLVEGTSETTFEPDRTITGKEFVKILLSALGYEGITLENCYEKGIECNLLNDSLVKSVVLNDEDILRSDAARICYGAMIAKTADGRMLYDKLCDEGVYDESDFAGTLYSFTPIHEETFDDKLNALMPEDENYMFSPLSIKTAFAMAANGAEGETKEEILSALGINDLDEFNKYIKNLMQDYSASELFTLNISNSIWLNESRTEQEFSESFKETLINYYFAEANTVNNDNAVKTINDFVSEKTNGKIDSITNSNEFWAMLINAVYFKAMWADEFSESATKPAEFTSRDGSVSEIDFMNQRDYFNYFANDDIIIVQLPYKSRVHTDDGEVLTSNANVSMYLIMSESDTSIDPEATLNDEELTRTYMNLAMPKFEFEYSTSLSDMMKSLGVSAAFSEDDAEFESMFNQGTMFISDSLHKTYIKVDEKGTEAAAVTSIGMTGASLPPEPIDVVFNKPFTFVIKDTTNNEILFIGEYAFAE
ncbi:MAG: S-layer homology domain-containing protein [Clostridia bacterium]|nr:S-layer homology domain-containing protein [Clostridia bacterium]